MSNTVQLNIDERKYCVCCPNCGRLTQKSYLTDSELQCPKCKCNFVALVKNGIITVFEVNFSEDAIGDKRMIAYKRSVSVG